MAHKEKMLQTTKRVRLFNCDNTYKLELVEKLLEESKKLLEDCGIHVELVGKHPFRLAQMSEMVNKIPTLKMDMAFFVVHAHESRLSINEDKAGIGYAKMYKALLKETEENVIVVIGGDDNYKGPDEENRELISRWAKRKVSSQFSEEYLDGRKSFIFSWHKQHRAIHEQALLHHFDPNKKGLKFEYQPPLPVQETNPKSLPQATSTEFENLRTPKSPSHNDKVTATMAAAKEKQTDNHPTGVSVPKNRDSSRNTFSPSSGETKDLAILGVHASSKTMDDVGEILEKIVPSPLLSEDHTFENLEPDKVERFLIENPLRFCVLVVDASILKDDFEKGKLEEYRRCFETAVKKVVVQVIILVCSFKTTKLSLTHEDEVNKLMRHFQNEEKVSILELDKGKFGVSVDDFLKILRQSFKLNTQMNLPRGSQEPDFHAYSLTADTHQFGERSNLLAEKTIVEKDLPNIPQLPSPSLVVRSSVLVLRGIFRYGALSDDWGDIHIRNSEIKIPDYIFEELLHRYLNISEVGVSIRKLANGSFMWIPDQNLRRFSPKKEVELNDKEKVVLKTRVRNGEISLEESDVQFLRENIPQHILDPVKAAFTGKPNGDLYVISDDAGKFRSVVKRGVKDITFGFIVQKKDDFLQQLNG